MTLCIAAAASGNEERYVVCCVDRRIEDSVSGSDTGYKVKKLPNGWGALLAGEIARAEELLTIYASELDNDDESPREYLEKLRRPAYQLKSRMIAEYTQSNFGLSYQDFLKLGSESMLPREVFAEAIYSIQRIEIPCELILFKAEGSGSRIFTVDGSCGVSKHPAFATIGSGSVVANVWLHFRQQRATVSLAETLYNVFEAKKFAENAPGVGSATKVLCISSSDRLAILTDEAAYLKLFRKCGPRTPVQDRLEEVDEDFRNFKWSEVRGSV
jgi:hypothetical protein